MFQCFLCFLVLGAGKSVVFVLQQERVTGDLCIKEDEVTKM